MPALALRAALALLVLGGPARAYYMPPAFDVQTVPGIGDNLNTSDPNTNGTASNATGLANGLFDLRNRTAWAAPQGEGARPEGAGGVEADAGHAGASANGTSPAVAPRDVWSPRITAPDAATVWKVGDTVQVRWDPSHPPKRVTNAKGKLVLGHYEDGDETSEHLNYQHPLADGFDLSQGHVNVKVPDVKPSNHYIVVLFGDSGNSSPQFTIVD